MKRIMLITFLLNGLFTYSQKVYFEDIYSYLDTTRLSTKILYNSIFPLVKTRYMQFSGLDDTVRIANNEWRQLYCELYCAHLKTRVLPQYFTIYDTIKSIYKQNKIPIGVINLNYNLIKDYAFDEGLLRYDSLYVKDGYNLSENPYSEHRCFAACVLTESINSFSALFCLNDNIVFSNTNETIQFYEIDFNDGNGYITMNPNGSHNVIYPSSGIKTISVEAHLSNGEVLYCKTLLNVQSLVYSSPPPILPPDTIVPFRTTYHYRVYNGTYGIWYGCNNNNQLKKPVIFVEGFDPSNDNILIPENGETSSGSLLYNIANQNSMLTELHNKGFDVIILDFAEGGALIQANAMLLKELINYVNENIQSDEKLVIIGASMGGLVARYALSYMESRNEDHNTKLFVSLDSPHQGAYVPLSLLHLYDQIEPVFYFELGFSDDFKKQVHLLQRKFRSPAAKQMLVYYPSARDNNQANPDSLRLEFINDLNSLTPDGYPQLCRKIAVSEGSGNASNQSGSLPGATYLEMENKEFNINNNRYKLDFKMRALTDHTSVNVLELNLEILLTFFGQQMWFSIISRTTDIQISYDNTKPYDFAPGGNYEMMETLCDAVGNALGEDMEYSGKECFIPSMSALDIRCSEALDYDIHQNITNNKDSAEVDNSNITPFDLIYIEKNNKTHINGGITPKMTKFILDEISPEVIVLDNIELSNTKKKYEASDSIIAGSEMGGEEHVFRIKNSSDILFGAGTTIVLKPGFSVEAGSKFKAYIKDFTCLSPQIFNIPVSYNYLSRTMDKNVILDINKKSDAPQLDNGLMIRPNPSNGVFILTINTDRKSNGRIQICNLFGKRVFEDVVETPCEKLISLPKLPGIYTITIFLNDSIISDKFMIR